MSTDTTRPYTAIIPDITTGTSDFMIYSGRKLPSPAIPMPVFAVPMAAPTAGGRDKLTISSRPCKVESNPSTRCAPLPPVSRSPIHVLQEVCCPSPLRSVQIPPDTSSDNNNATAITTTTATECGAPHHPFRLDSLENIIYTMNRQHESTILVKMTMPVVERTAEATPAKPKNGANGGQTDMLDTVDSAKENDSSYCARRNEAD